MLTGEALSKVFAYLTDEQRTQLETMAAERKGRRADKGRRAERRNPQPEVG